MYCHFEGCSQKGFKNVDVIARRQEYHYIRGEADCYEFYMEDPVGVGYIYSKWYKVFQHVWKNNTTTHFQIKIYKKL